MKYTIRSHCRLSPSLCSDSLKPLEGKRSVSIKKHFYIIAGKSYTSDRFSHRDYS